MLCFSLPIATAALLTLLPLMNLPAEDFSVNSVKAGIKLEWEAKSGYDYTIWWSPSLDPPVWERAGRVFSRTSGAMWYFDPQGNVSQGYYRLEQSKPMILVPGSDGGGVDYNFHIGRYEVTTAEFADFLADPATSWSRWHDAKKQKIVRVVDKKAGVWVTAPMTGWEDRPVQQISWEAAAAFCNWLSQKEGLGVVYDEAGGWVADVSKNGYRLPTSKEWYKAGCWDPTKEGAGGFWTYACQQDALRYSQANYGGSYDPYAFADTDALTTPVGFYDGSAYRLFFTPTPESGDFYTEDAKSYYGCYDMEGNVSEYVMIEADNAFVAGAMGSSWSWTYPSSWEHNPISEPRLVVSTDRLHGFRIARTAVPPVGTN
ncbi:MAG: SUMF1/EgtB/PvdO family nonheme iron enzyme [bacterium]|nr:SUMF1/EgtB/PvdO family nonheme iron enzyme [bacterium]